MGLWCSQMSTAGWVLMAAIWVTVIGLVVWAVCRLFPAQRTPEAYHAAGDIDLES